jgi:pyruvate/2-oxoglutarate dehydrogenase complex dihydrolipoamide dehydrogenase (E3) component
VEPARPAATAGIVGAAATGCQLASVMNTFGSAVTLLDVAPHILPIEDAAVTEALTNGFTERGIPSSAA